jgi:hypothetical protein
MIGSSVWTEDVREKKTGGCARDAVNGAYEGNGITQSNKGAERLFDGRPRDGPTSRRNEPDENKPRVIPEVCFRPADSYASRLRRPSNSPPFLRSSQRIDSFSRSELGDSAPCLQGSSRSPVSGSVR